MKIFIVVILLAIATSIWAIDRCSVVRAVRRSGIADYKGYTVGDYVCLAAYASNYDEYLNRSPSEYGVFQINSYWWCDDGYTSGRKNLCGIPCSALLGSYLDNDLRCVRRIVQDPNGLGAWSVWKSKCQGRNNNRFTAGC